MLGCRAGAGSTDFIAVKEWPSSKPKWLKILALRCLLSMKFVDDGQPFSETAQLSHSQCLIPCKMSNAKMSNRVLTQLVQFYGHDMHEPR